MPIAYLIRAHERPAQLGRLVDRLKTPSARFYIHVSARTSTETYGAMREEVGESDEIRWLPRIPMYYAGYSLVHAALLGVHAIAREDPVPSHTVGLSGQDYPLRPAAEIERFFQERPAQSFLQHFRLPTSDHWPGENGGTDRIRRYYFERVAYRSRLLRVPLVRRRFPAGLTPYGGSAWWALASDAVVELDRYVDDNPRVLDFFRHAKMPDELLVHTILMNSPVRNSIVNEEIHHIEWQGGSHPRTFTSADTERVLASGKLFARKFDVEIDEQALDVIDREALEVHSLA